MESDPVFMETDPDPYQMDPKPWFAGRTVVPRATTKVAVRAPSRLTLQSNRWW